jgi:hypothetical protein
MATLWLHKPTGCDFLISFKKKSAALDFTTNVFDKAASLLKEEANYSLNEMQTDGILVSDKEIPLYGINVGSLSMLQVVILPAGCVPQPGYYSTIAHVFAEDALKMVFEKEPSQYYIHPPEFVMSEREEPYNFTRYIPNKYELDDELGEYMMAAY